MYFESTLFVCGFNGSCCCGLDLEQGFFKGKRGKLEAVGFIEFGLELDPLESQSMEETFHHVHHHEHLGVG
jgi:hypothetical protein